MDDNEKLIFAAAFANALLTSPALVDSSRHAAILYAHNALQEFRKTQTEWQTFPPEVQKTLLEFNGI